MAKSLKQGNAEYEIIAGPAFLGGWGGGVIAYLEPALSSFCFISGSTYHWFWFTNNRRQGNSLTSLMGQAGGGENHLLTSVMNVPNTLQQTSNSVMFSNVLK